MLVSPVRGCFHMFQFCTTNVILSRRLVIVLLIFEQLKKETRHPGAFL